MNSMRKKKGTFAARAHSFKENFLDVLKNSPNSTSTPHKKGKSEKSFIHLAKKTGSTDNLTGHLGTARSTDCLVKEVQFALKYFQDAVSKGTYEMLPGCATVVLETLLAIQAFAGSVEDPMDPEVKKSLESSFRSASRLTSWADTVIVSGEVNDADSVLEDIIEPVRKSVIVVVNLISGRIGTKNLTRGNSLPDITCESSEPESTYGLSLSSESILDISPVKPPLLPKISLCATESAPPLPPKHLKPRLDRQIEDLISRSYSFHHGDALCAPHFYGFPGLKRTPKYGLSVFNRTLQTPDGPEVLPLDQSNDLMDCVDSPYSLSKESVNNISFDDVESGNYRHGQNLSSRSWSSKERSNASSPSMESFGSHLSDTVEREFPPAIPRKYKDSMGRRNGGGTFYSNADVHNRSMEHPRRKLSEYDNVVNPERTLDNLTRLSLEDDSNHPLHSGSPRSESMYQFNSNQFDQRGPTTTWSKIAESRQSYQERPPPLPPKKRNVMSYMEMFGKTILPSGEDILHGFFQTHDLLHNVWQHNFHEYSEYAPTGLLNFPLIDNAYRESKKANYTPSNSNSHYVNHSIDVSDTPPALPPKRSRSRPGSFRSSGNEERTIPIIREDQNIRMSQASDNSLSSNSSSEMPKMAEITKLPRLSVPIPIERIKEPGSKHPPEPDDGEKSVLQTTDVAEKLVYGSTQEKSGGTSELRAGTADALVVLATQTIKNDFLYQEAFLTTYRTFLTTELLVDKLVYRYRYFAEKSSSGEATDSSFRRASRAAFSLLVRVVDGLAEVDFHDKTLLEKLTQFITSLIEKGNLGLARALRSQFIMKYEEMRTRLLPEFDLASMNSINRRCTLLNFKSSDLAEQMTLLDSNLFMRIDSAELVNWVQEQCEEKSPNLTKFTEHFNNMSYWTRTLILSQPDAKEREKYVMKFIKMMKWLRKMNNFNSYLALLSALDSAPIRRLEWQKNITEGLKEYCSLIDSSSSFRAYRSALGDATPPCIPYIGLVLQDLTFVHIGNPHNIDGKVNFAKRWQQFNILDNLRRFKKVQYQISRHEEIIQFFGDFSEFLSEDEMWNISESIRPRGQSNKAK